MEDILYYESKRNIIFQKIFESTNLERTEIIIIFLLKDIKSKIRIKKIKEMLSYLPPSEISMSVTKLDKKGYLDKTRPSYDERILVIDNINFKKISHTVDICNDIIKSQLPL